MEGGFGAFKQELCE